MSLLGALTNKAVALIIPPIVDIITRATDGNLHWFIVAKNSFISVMVFRSFVNGITISVTEIVNVFKAGKPDDSNN